MKSYTDIEQSQKLAEILPIESADIILTLEGNSELTSYPIMRNYSEFYNYLRIFELEEKYIKRTYIPAWSLASLMESITKVQQGGIFYNLTYDFILSKWTMNIEADNWRGDVGLYDNPVDAYVNMILKLHEQKLL